MPRRMARKRRSECSRSTIDLYYGIVVVVFGVAASYIACFPALSSSFVVVIQRGRRTQLTGLFMGKGFTRARNKQQELLKKMELAKLEKGTTPKTTATPPTTEDEKEHEEFAKLLRTTVGALPTGDGTTTASIETQKTKNKKKKTTAPPSLRPKRKPKSKKKQEQQQQQPYDTTSSQRSHFEALLDVSTNTRLGPIGAATLVPWVPPYRTACLLVFCDPRTASDDLRRTIDYVASTCSTTTRKTGGTSSSTAAISSSQLAQHIVFITADTVPETQAWMKRNHIARNVRIYSDPQLDWMSTYQVLEHWTGVSMLTFDIHGNLVDTDSVRGTVTPTDALTLAQHTIERMMESNR